ncbi:hypothetical protein J6590_092295 [Homalodisca vitripennis]|nr:hypothetical protein J6590_092295 [Homalodisca vitripennis]
MGGNLYLCTDALPDEFSIQGQSVAVEENVFVHNTLYPVTEEDIAILLAVIYGGFSVDIQCPEEGCGNLTIYLGPNRDSKIVILTRSEGNPEHSNEHPSRPLPTNTPVPTTSKIPRIFKLNESFFKTTSRYFRSYTTTSKPLFRNSTFRSTISQSDQRLLDLSYKDITGEDLAGLLSRLTETAQANIRYMYLSHNRISDLPVFTFIRARLQLTVLRIDNNHLGQSYTTFSEIFNLHTLRELNMSRCGLTSLECLYNPSLEVLDLSYNRLQSIPTYLDRLPNLNRLILDGNQIQFLHYFPHSSNLQHLYLSNNNLSYISNNTFQSFRGWFQLRVNNNSLEDASLIHVNRFFVLYLGGIYRKITSTLQKCLDGDPRHPTPRPVTSLTRSNMKSACERSTWETVSEGWSTASTWVLQHSPSVSTICDFLGCVLFSILIVLALRTVRQRVTPLQLPYTILDNKQAA